MKVKELIENLKEYDEDLEVVVWQWYDCWYNWYDEWYESVDWTEIISSYNDKTKAIQITTKPWFLCEF